MIPFLPFRFYPVLIFSSPVGFRPNRLFTDGTNFSIQIVVDDGRYLEGVTNVRQSWEPIIIPVQKPQSIP